MTAIWQRLQENYIIWVVSIIRLLIIGKGARLGDLRTQSFSELYL